MLSRAIWKRIFHWYCWHGLLVYAFLLVKNLLIVALDLPGAAHLRWLDCYLLGRLQLASRIPRASKYCAIVVDCLLITNRLLFIRFAEELHLLGEQFITFGGPALGGAEPDAATSRRRFLLGAHVVNQLSVAGAPLRRPNRAARRPRWELVLVIAGYSLGAIYCAFYLTSLAATASQLFVTKRGFELLYPNCVGWILRRAQADAGRNQFAAIYQINASRSLADIFAGPLPLQLPLIDFVPVNLYHSARVAADMLEFYLGQLDIIVFYTFHLNLVARLSLDLIIYVRHLRRQLAIVAGQLALQARFAAYKARSRAHFTPTVDEPQLVALQASLLDYFRFVRAYNPYVSAASLVHMTVWLLNALLIFVRYLKSDKFKLELETGVHFEFLFLFFSTLAPVLLSLLGEFVLASQARRMFAQMAAVMALDCNPATKLRWATLMKFYHPRSLFCFTALNTIELSWLFGLKLLAWLISAIIVLRSL